MKEQTKAEFQSKQDGFTPDRASVSVLTPFINQCTVLLTTCRRDATPVRTPVNIAIGADRDRAFIRTYDASWKFKRIRNNLEVEIAPSTFGGRSTGPAIRARARILNGTEWQHANRAINRKYPLFQGILIRLAHRLRRYKTMHIELALVGDTSSDESGK